MPEQQKEPDTLGLVQSQMLPKLELYRDVLGGTTQMREKADKYLPPFPAEETKDYNDRLKEAVFYNATELTVDALVGLVFQTDPELAENLPAEILADAENVDLAGRHIHVLAKDLFRDAWDGIACVLVDMQRVDRDHVRSRADERRAGLRPYWVPIQARQILRARAVNINGKEVLGRFAYRETIVRDDGEFGEVEVERVRDYRLDVTPTGNVASYKVFEKRETDDKKLAWRVVEDGVLDIGEIPVAPCYTGRVGFFAAEPPLLDLAYENIDHYQQRSEHRVSWKYARVPVQIYPGMDPEQVVISAHRGICTPDTDAKPYYMETSGAALDGSKTELQESERRMSNMGAQMLYRPERGNETATARRIENAQSNSRLASAARALQDCLEECVRLHAKWRNIDLPEQTDGRWVTVTRDFEAYEMDAQTIVALNNAVGAGNLRHETFLTALRDGVPVLSFLDPEKEAEMLEGAGLTPPRREPGLPALDSAA